MKNGRHFVKQALITCTTAAWLFSSAASASGLKSQLDKIFDGMSHGTPPGVYETQRRGVLAGGRYTVKTRIFDENLVSIAPPSWKAGCGGVDLFGGSMSFIKTDQIVELLRSVAANAKGYAFQLALDTVFPDGAKWIENFQKKVQALNQYLGNSCQLAQGLVNDVAELSPWEIKGQTNASIQSTVKGICDDVFECNAESKGKSGKEQLRDHDVAAYNELIGNIIWKQLKKNNVNNWFTYGDYALMEAMMSLTGTVIIDDLAADPNIPVPSSGVPHQTNNLHMLAKKLKIADFIEGGEIEVYSCGSDLDHCISAKDPSSITKINLEGFKDKILNILLGGGSSVGIIHKYATNQGALSDAEQAFITNMPAGMGAVVRNLSVLSRDSAAMFATEASGAIALAMVYNFAEELLRATKLAMTNSQSPHKVTALEVISEAERELRHEYQSLIAIHGDLTHLLSKYNTILDNTRKQRYLLATLTNPPRSKD